MRPAQLFVAIVQSPCSRFCWARYRKAALLAGRDWRFRARVPAVRRLRSALLPALPVALGVADLVPPGDAERWRRAATSYTGLLRRARFRGSSPRPAPHTTSSHFSRRPALARRWTCGQAAVRAEPAPARRRPDRPLAAIQSPRLGLGAPGQARSVVQRPAYVIKAAERGRAILRCTRTSDTAKPGHRVSGGSPLAAGAHPARRASHPHPPPGRAGGSQAHQGHAADPGHRLGRAPRGERRRRRSASSTRPIRRCRIAESMGALAEVFFARAANPPSRRVRT